VEVRVGSDRPNTYEFDGDQFLVGGAIPCDIRLPDAGVPPIVCHFARTPAGVRVRRVAPAFPILLNGSPLTGTDPVPVPNGATVAVGSVDIRVTTAAEPVRPTFILPNADRGTRNAESPSSSAREQELDARERELNLVREELAALREELVDRYRAGRAELDRRLAELEGDARQRIEAELRAAEPRLAEYRVRKAEIDAAAADLTARRADFALDRNQLDADRAALETDRAAVSAKEADLSRREGELAAGRTSLAHDREAHAADLVRSERWQATLDDRQRSLDVRAAEIDARFEQLKRDTLELEEQVRLADAEQERITAEADRLDKLRTEVDDRAARLNDRATHLEAQQAMLAVLRARLDRQAEDSRQESARLAAGRAKLDESRAELAEKLREAEHLKIDLTATAEGNAEQQRHLAEQAARLDTSLAEVRQQQETLVAEAERLRAKEDELDARSAEIAEQAAVLKARVTQAMDLQARLEADRTAVRTRETTLTDAETARVTFQEQLRRRAEDLSARAKQLDEATAKFAEREAELDRLRAELAKDRELAEHGFAATRSELGERSVELARHTALLGEREAALERQVARLQEVGRGVASAKKHLAEAKAQLEADRAAVDAHRQQVAGEIDELRRAAPELEDRAAAAVDRLSAARDVLRGQLAELHEYAAQTRADLAAARSAVASESEGLHAREQLLEQARSEHRLAVAQFRQQLVEWQARVADLKRAMARTETRIDARHAEMTAATSHIEATTQELAKQAEELRVERQLVADRRAEVERHLNDMREWYRKKLRELASQNAERGIRNAESGEQPDGIAGRVGTSALPVPHSELDDGDRQLGELLRSLELVDADTLAALWAEANARRRTLRQVLLASGVITLYQLALIEAGNLDALMLGRFRVVDRVRVTPHETAYRVYDPSRSGTFLLRVMAELDAQDAVLPDEFRQRFAAAKDAAHPNLLSTVEVLDVAGRPAVLQEWATGVPGSDWSAAASTPGVWVRLVSNAAAALESAHAVGLSHGRIAADAFVLTPDGTVKLTSVGDPPWLGGAADDASPLDDLRALGRVAFGWSQLGASVRKRGAKVKGFPEPLLAVVRRLEEPGEPVADAPPSPEPYHTATELVADLSRLAPAFPCPPAEWDRLVQSPISADEPARQSA
jgi:chromosome segregation ATPase